MMSNYLRSFIRAYEANPDVLPMDDPMLAIETIIQEWVETTRPSNTLFFNPFNLDEAANIRSLWKAFPETLKLPNELELAHQINAKHGPRRQYLPVSALIMYPVKPREVIIL